VGVPYYYYYVLVVLLVKTSALSFGKSTNDTIVKNTALGFYAIKSRPCIAWTVFSFCYFGELDLRLIRLTTLIRVAISR